MPAWVVSSGEMQVRWYSFHSVSRVFTVGPAPPAQPKNISGLMGRPLTKIVGEP